MGLVRRRGRDSRTPRAVGVSAQCRLLTSRHPEATMENATARDNAIRQGTEHPCGAVDGDETSLSYFEEVERLRYEQQSWQAAVFRFDQYQGRRVLEIGVGLGTDLA